MRGSGFLSGFTRTTLQLLQLKQARDNELARQEQQKEHLKLLRKQAEGQEADLKLKEQAFLLKAHQMLQEQRSLQPAFEPAPAETEAEAPAGPQAPFSPVVPPAAVSQPPGEAPSRPLAAPTEGQEAVFRAQLSSLQQTERALQARIFKLINPPPDGGPPATFTEAGKRIIGALQTEHTRTLGEIKRLQDLLVPGGTEAERITGRSMAVLSPEQIRAAHAQVQKERVTVAQEQQRFGLGIVAQKQFESTLAAEKARNQARKEELLLPTADERKEYREGLSALASLDALLPRAADPANAEILGPLFSENPTAAIRRRLGAGFEQVMNADQREFLAELGRVMAGVRKTFMGVAQTPTELTFGRTYLPTADDIAPTVIAKLTAMREVAARDLEAFRTTGKHLGIRQPFQAVPVGPTLPGAHLLERYRRP